MSIRTTVTLDDDVIERVRSESRHRGKSFKVTLNELLRLGLLSREQKPSREKFTLTTFSMGFNGALNHDKAEALLEYGEGEMHK